MGTFHPLPSVSPAPRPCMAVSKTVSRISFTSSGEMTGTETPALGERSVLLTVPKTRGPSGTRATQGSAGIGHEARGQVEIRGQNLDVDFVGKHGEGRADQLKGLTLDYLNILGRLRAIGAVSSSPVPGPGGDLGRGEVGLAWELKEMTVGVD